VLGIEINRRIAKKYPFDVIVADMRTLNGENFKGFDVIWGSPPCRDFSFLAKWYGKRWKIPPDPQRGLKLVNYFLKFVEDAQPAIWVLENTFMLKNYLKSHKPKIETYITRGKRHVFYYLKKLQKADLVRRQVRSSVVFYDLTNKGKELLASCEGLVYGSGVFRLHKCKVKFRIVREGCYPRGRFREVELVNWTQLLGLERGVSVQKTTRHWVVHVEALYGRYPGELFGLAKNLADRVVESMVLKYGVVLGEGKICKGYELAIDDPVAKLLARYFCVSTPKRKMDHSPGELMGEIDHLSRDAAIEYLMMPERVKKVEGQLAGTLSKLTDLENDVHNLVEVLSSGALSKLDDLEKDVHDLVKKAVAAPKAGKVDSSQPLKDKSRRYIS